MELLTPSVYRNLAELTETLRQGVRKVCTELETPVQVTGLGSLFGIHFTPPEVRTYRDIAAEDADLRHRMFLGLLNEGVLVASNLVGSLSTQISEGDIAGFCAAFRKVLERNR